MNHCAVASADRAPPMPYDGSVFHHVSCQFCIRMCTNTSLGNDEEEEEEGEQGEQQEQDEQKQHHN